MNSNSKSLFLTLRTRLKSLRLHMALNIYSNLWQVVLPLLAQYVECSIWIKSKWVTNGAQHWDLTTLYMYLGHNSNLPTHFVTQGRAGASMLTGF